MSEENKLNSADNLFDYWQIIKEHKKKIVFLLFFITFMAVCVSLLMPIYYKSAVVIMPITRSKADLGGLSGIASLAGITGSPLSQASSSQQFMALLKTRSIAEEVIRKNNLLQVLVVGFKPTQSAGGPDFNQEKAMEMAVKGLLGSRVQFMEDKKLGTISIEAEFKDPKLAAQVANSYAECLEDFIQKNVLTIAKRNRMFIEKQYNDNKVQFLKNGNDLDAFYDRDKSLHVKSRVDISNYEEDAARLIAGYSALHPESSENVDALLKSVPQSTYLSYLNVQRRVLEESSVVISRQYEMAKIEETREDLAFQIIDPARMPHKKSKPHRRNIVVSSFFFSLALGLFLAFFLEYLSRVRTKFNNRYQETALNSETSS